MEVSGKFHAPAALPPGKNPWYLMDMRMSRPQSRSERSGEGKKFPTPVGNRISIVQPVAESLYFAQAPRLS
jgi:hypothetical protein